MFIFNRYYFFSARCVTKGESHNYVNLTITTRRPPTMDELVEEAKKLVPSADSILILSLSRLTKAEYRTLSKAQTKYK